MDSINSTGQRDTGALARIIRDEIARAGVITFARYMELALYHPDHGYYRYTHIGKSGDYFTSISVGPLFGQMLAFYLSSRLQAIAGNVEIVEAGANDGTLARDILTWLKAERGELYERVTYRIVEPFVSLRDAQREKLAGHRVEWFGSVDELPQITGAFVSNELLDAFPVHVVRWQKAEGRWREFGVNMEFRWAPMQQMTGGLEDRLREIAPLEPVVPDQFTVEFSPSAEDFWKRICAKLTAGTLVAVDYGDTYTGVWSPSRAVGTIRAYRNHKLVENPFANPGEQDLTATVNFTRIAKAGEAQGLMTLGIERQASFLAKIAPNFFSKTPDPKQVRQFQTLTHPEHLGRAFRVLVQSRTNS